MPEEEVDYEALFKDLFEDKTTLAEQKCEIQRMLMHARRNYGYAYKERTSHGRTLQLLKTHRFAYYLMPYVKSVIDQGALVYGIAVAELEFFMAASWTAIEKLQCDQALLHIRRGLTALDKVDDLFNAGNSRELRLQLTGLMTHIFRYGNTDFPLPRDNFLNGLAYLYDYNEIEALNPGFRHSVITESPSIVAYFQAEAALVGHPAAPDFEYAIRKFV